MEYLGENLFPGQLGQIFVVFSFCLAILSAISYSIAVNKSETTSRSYIRLGRIAFTIHGTAVIGIVIALFYIIYQHYFEYNYAWAHSSLALPTHYVISCFWEGQEGSFLLWTFWHVCLGLLLFKAGKWEAPVMAVLSFAQVMLTSMLLGYYFFDYRLGSSPFLLLRDAMPDAPIFSDPNYLALYLTDGKGLNPLLQNIWMVIHPPVVFLGFASTIVPFAFAIAGLWTNRVKEWIRPAFPWALFNVVIAGTGILMGGMWAYEALSFGGYWSWDPVENASLVPWLTMIAGVHTMLIYKHTGKAAFTSYLLIMVSFILVLYATFLVRSGILGESSVHAFTDLGLSGQLLLFLFFFCALPVVFSSRSKLTRLYLPIFLAAIFTINLFVGHFIIWLNLISAALVIILLFVNLNKATETSETEDNYLSREFWLFMGVLVLCLSAVHITFVTSFPVWNKLFGLNLAPPTDAISSYNRIQLPLSVIIIILTSLGMILKYKKTDKSFFANRVLFALIPAVVLGLIIAYFGKIADPLHVLLLMAALFGAIGNIRVLINQKKKFIKTGGSIAHIGFAIMLLGILFSGAKQEVISKNKKGIDFGDHFDPESKANNALLWINDPSSIGKYEVTYLGDSTSEPNTYYKVRYREYSPDSSSIVDEFFLYPNAQVNPKMGLLANPDTKHWLTADLFTHVTQVLDKSNEENKPGYSDPVEFQLRVSGDTLVYQGKMIFFEGLSLNLTEDEQKKVEGAEIALKANLNVKSGLKEGDVEVIEQLSPIFAVKGSLIYNYEDEAEKSGLKVNFVRFDPEEELATIAFQNKEKEIREYIIMKAIVFPYINLLWGGLIILIIGFSLAIINRKQENDNQISDVV